MSIDGYLDDMNAARLMLSNQEDFDRVDEVRAGVDAILVGANTIRRDTPAARALRALPGFPARSVMMARTVFHTELEVPVSAR